MEPEKPHSGPGRSGEGEQRCRQDGWPGWWPHTHGEVSLNAGAQGGRAASHRGTDRALVRGNADGSHAPSAARGCAILSQAGPGLLPLLVSPNGPQVTVLECPRAHR